MAVFAKLRESLKGVREKWSNGISRLFTSGKFSPDFWDSLEEQLIKGDAGLDFTEEMIDFLKTESKKKGIKSPESLKEIFTSKIVDELNSVKGMGQPFSLAEKPLVLLMAPWSPPPFMKTNGEMNHGGELKPEYRQLWADYYVRFIQEYKKRGIDISFTSIQNEPNATQTWDSCRYTAEQEADFAVDFLGPTLEKAGLLDEVRVLVWDHNKEVSYRRFKDIMSKDGADKYIFGCAVHWYTGDHFENLGLIRKHFPSK
ncbi:MAG: signal recognition particle receptor subunit alpha, partial [Synergistaceae bacterium]|nr:signal recognition particle receptor subunit alpha [Synergistaceae bacterium]